MRTQNERGIDSVAAIRLGGLLEKIYQTNEIPLCPISMSGWRLVRKLSEWVENEKITLLHTHLTGATRIGLQVARLTGVPIVAHARIFRDCPAYHEAAQAGILIANSRATARFYEQAGIPAERIATVLNATSIHEQSHRNRSKQDLADQFKLDPTLPWVLTPGRLTREKGQDILVEAASLLSRQGIHAEFLLAGCNKRFSPFRKKLKTMVAEHQLQNRVHFLGFQRALAPLMRVVDLQVIPSRVEPFGLVVIEGLAMGKPVVAAAAGGIPEIISSPEIGWTVPPDSPEALAAAIAQVLASPAKARRIAEKGRLHAMEQFDRHRMAEKLESIYNELIR